MLRPTRGAASGPTTDSIRVRRTLIRRPNKRGFAPARDFRGPRPCRGSTTTAWISSTAGARPSASRRPEVHSTHVRQSQTQLRDPRLRQEQVGRAVGSGQAVPRRRRSATTGGAGRFPGHGGIPGRLHRFTGDHQRLVQVGPDVTARGSRWLRRSTAPRAARWSTSSTKRRPTTTRTTHWSTRPDARQPAPVPSPREAGLG